MSSAINISSAEQKKQDRDAFMALFPTLVNDVMASVAAYSDFDSGAVQWFKTVRDSIKKLFLFRLEEV